MNTISKREGIFSKNATLVLLLLSLASLICLSLIHADLFQRLWEILPAWISRPAMLILYVFPALVVLLAAVLISTSIKLLRLPSQASTPPQDFSHRHIQHAILRLLLACLLLFSLAYVTFWESVWDQTSDGLGGLWLAYQSSLAAVICGAVMGIAARRWFRSAGFFFALLVPLLLLSSFRGGWSVDYQALTEQRAVRIAAALDHYHAREGKYPEQLQDLTPRDLLWVPDQLILRHEDWCYLGRQEHYLLGAYWRKHFSTPLEIKVYAAGGQISAADWLCQIPLSEKKKQYDPIDIFETNQP